GVVLVPERASPSISVGSWSRIAAWAGSAGGASAQAGRTSVAGHRFQLTGFSSAMAGRAKAMLSGRGSSRRDRRTGGRLIGQTAVSLPYHLHRGNECPVLGSSGRSTQG